MGTFEISIDSRAVLVAMRKGPAVLVKHLDRAIGRTVLEMSRDARADAPKAHSHLTNAITVRRPDPLTGEVVAATDYARMAEEGTGSGGYPPLQTMLDWLSVKGIEPRDPDMDQRDLAFTIARQIAISGTPAQPFLEPALENNKAKAQRRINAAIDAALKEMR